MALNLDTLQQDFKNEMGGGLYVPKVTEGTVVDLFDIKTGIRGTQQLNTIAITPSWQTDHDTAITNANVTPFSAEGNSDVDLDAVTLTVGTEFFQAPVNPYVFDQSYLRADGSYYDPQLAAVQGITEAAVKQGRKKFTEAFLNGIGAGASSTNGINDLVKNTINTGTGDISNSNVLTKLGIMHETVAASAIGGDADQFILMGAADYVIYRQGLRAAGLNDVLQTQASESGLMVSQFVDDPRVSIVGEANQASTVQPIWTSMDNLYVATSALRDHESPEIFYDRVFNAWYVRMFAALGVQAYSAGATGLVFANNNAA